ncbi:hypothetical protein [Alkanindiges illinoisensis]|uniref:hypothetical protein n=1 Tax=Alkanindiges illinoisensis TaxID=197183 RepID=UPI0012EBFBE2|nr:hypothetical protein [Alkanindiges illinoisensis]
MKKFILVCSVYGLCLLTGCGNEDNPLSAGGVSLGGTGTGSPSTGSTIPPTLPGQGHVVFKPDFYKVTYPDNAQQNCAGIQRSFRFIDKETGQVIPAGEQRIIPKVTDIDPTNMVLQIRVQNTTSHIMYEYHNACALPFKLVDDQGYEHFSNQQFSCSSGESIHIIQPHECKTYEFKFDLPKQLQQWQLNYQISYETQYSADISLKKDHQSQCDALQTSIRAEPSDDDSSSTSADSVQSDVNSTDDPCNIE